MTAIYDKIGVGYAGRRTTDPKIAQRIWAALGSGRTLLNVGAGTGSYEPSDRNVVAIEPSSEMIAQRPEGAAPAIQGTAESIPFADKQFDAAMGVLTLHHWSDVGKGLAEMLRVTRTRVVLVTFDPGFSGYWLEDYLPNLFDIDRHCFPAMDYFRGLQSRVEIEPLLIPHDCQDGFLCAYWRRPEAYLNPDVRKSISTFAKLEGAEEKLKPLASDLASGAWAKKYGALLQEDALDLGYRLITITLDT